MKKKGIENSARSLTGVTLIGCALAGCVANHGADQVLTRRLNDRGPISVSPNNPYLAGNLLLSKEMEHSPELAGFVQTRGAPASIEVNQGTFSPLVIVMYYPENREYYAAEKGDGIWIIKGPETISEEKSDELKKHAGQPAFAAPPEEPVEKNLTLADAFQNFPQKTEPQKPESAVEHEEFPKGIEHNEHKEIEHKPGPKHATEAPAHPPKSPEHKEAAPKVQEERPESMLGANERHLAELSPRGDLVHYVTYHGETLSMLARWYTHDRVNAGKIARINKLGEPNVLSIGDVVVIPSYMLKNKYRMTETAVKLLSANGHK